MSLPDARAWAEIDLAAIRANITALRAYLGAQTRLLAVVKADAYGHGLVPVAEAAAVAGADWLGIATVAEGVTLREAGVRLPIVLLCAILPNEAAAALEHRLTLSIGDSATLRAVACAARCRVARRDPPEVHLDIDTGIGRAGVLPVKAVDLWRAAVEAGLRVSGLCTHFADADGVDAEFTAAQEAAFRRVREALEAAGARFETVHLSNSPATLRFRNSGGNLVRPGLLMYGILPALPDVTILNVDPNNAVPLPVFRPALTLKARVATVRALPAGHPISYGATHRLSRPSLVATVLIGYGDGYPRRLSNCGAMLLRGRRAPILGRVCMDQTVVDVTGIPGVVPGDEAVCIGSQGAESIRVEEIARRIDTTEHEITTCLTPRIPRRYLP